MIFRSINLSPVLQMFHPYGVGDMCNSEARGVALGWFILPFQGVCAIDIFTVRGQGIWISPVLQMFHPYRVVDNCAPEIQGVAHGRNVLPFQGGGWMVLPEGQKHI